MMIRERNQKVVAIKFLEKYKRHISIAMLVAITIIMLVVMHGNLLK